MPQTFGTPSRNNLRCTSCGYGVLVRLAPDRCPMCGGAAWEHAGAELLRRLLQVRVEGEAPDKRTLFRHLNENLAVLADEDEFELVCECANGRCFAAVRLTRDDFLAVTSVPGNHVVAPGHEAAGEEIVGGGPRFAVVGFAPLAALSAPSVAGPASAGQ